MFIALVLGVGVVVVIVVPAKFVGIRPEGFFYAVHGRSMSMVGHTTQEQQQIGIALLLLEWTCRTLLFVADPSHATLQTTVT